MYRYIYTCMHIYIYACIDIYIYPDTQIYVGGPGRTAVYNRCGSNVRLSLRISLRIKGLCHRRSLRIKGLCHRRGLRRSRA